ncbi:MAG: hypothetical protein K2X94_05225 [Amoebophilaceae bacterium]|nr:hypothetical protein [Amoebophilaceae bacterium]MBY0244592.1 hypothetical protein [Sphingobacteriaceae bacterium]
MPDTSNHNQTREIEKEELECISLENLLNWTQEKLMEALTNPKYEKIQLKILIAIIILASKNIKSPNFKNLSDVIHAYKQLNEIDLNHINIMYKRIAEDLERHANPNKNELPAKSKISTQLKSKTTSNKDDIDFN